MPFSKLGLSDLIVNAISELGYIKPTEIQKQAISIILSGKGLIASAQTGTGKTASFVLPLLEKMQSESAIHTRSIHVLILVPSRELAT